MALNINRKSSVVSGSRRGGAVVSGSRGVGGRVIGEVLSGGRNIHGVAIKKRATPRPTRNSSRHTLHPAPKPRSIDGDDYSDFGFAEESWDESWEEPQSTGSSYSGAMVRQRQDEFNILVYLLQALGVVAGGLTRVFLLGVAYYVFSDEISREFPFLKISLIPLLLAVWCGAGMGAGAKKRVALGQVALPSALLGAVLGALVVGGGLYALARYIGFYPMFVLAEIFDLPFDVYDQLRILDQGVTYLFTTFKMATYAVIPLFGAVLGWTFGKK